MLPVSARSAPGADAPGRMADLPTPSIVLSKAAKNGEWIHVPIPRNEIKAGRAHVVFNDEYQQGYDCVKTGIRRIKWNLGEIE